MTSKQRAYLKSLAMTMDPILQIGKASLTPENTASVEEALEARELIKINVLQNCMDDPREIAQVLAERTPSQVVQVIGKKIVLYKEGKTAEELVEWAKTEVDKYAIYFYVDDLNFFRQSGRVSGLAGVMGNLLGIHPIIHINGDGIMTNISKAHGKMKTLNKIMEMIDSIQENIKDYPIVIAHSDVEDIALKAGEMLKEKYGNDLQIEYIVVNPTAGSHCGPGGVGVAFHAKHR